MAKIIYTLTDEAPLLATYSFLPVIEAFASTAGVDVETRDISVAARILAVFADQLPDDQKTADALAELGELATTPSCTSVRMARRVRMSRLLVRSHHLWRALRLRARPSNNCGTRGRVQL